IRRNEINDLTRAKIKSAVKGVKIGLKTTDANSVELLSKAYRELDLAAKKNVIHKNKASRLKSRLTKLVAKSALDPEKAVKKVAGKKAVKKTTKKK
ncbi:MAG TPA: 30S ribosomal protein S20, partial [Patescibacteria group bacterium]|nr:30S ribosomal protein S20 [Patescibacteria group bacterium]